MKTFFLRGTSRMFGALSCALLLFLLNTTQATESLRVVRIEEDWELRVGDPDPDSLGPQVTCAFSPSGDAAGLFAVFELNHRSLPEFQAGGIQLQVWRTLEPVASCRSDSAEVLFTSDEVVRWTQVMELHGSELTFEIQNGQSATWGEFGGDGLLRRKFAADLQDLNNYRPEFSIANSGVGFAGNRVRSLTLRRVRYYLSNGMSLEDDTVRAVASNE